MLAELAIGMRVRNVLFSDKKDGLIEHASNNEILGFVQVYI